VRGGEPRAHLGRSRRPSFSPAERRVRGGWDFGRVPQTGREEDEWTVVRRRSRRARRQAETGFDRQIQEERSRFGGVAFPYGRFYSPSREHRSISVDRDHWLYHRDGCFSNHAESRDTCRQHIPFRNRPVMQLRHHSPQFGYAGSVRHRNVEEIGLGRSKQVHGAANDVVVGDRQMGLDTGRSVQVHGVVRCGSMVIILRMMLQWPCLVVMQVKWNGRGKHVVMSCNLWIMSGQEHHYKDM
jgi:hypothetical protein